MTVPEQEILLAALGALFLPLASFIVSSAIPSRYSWITPPAATLAMLMSSICAILLFTKVWNGVPVVLRYPWFSAGSLSIPVGFQLDNLSVLMILMVSLVSFLVHLYSIGFMAGDMTINRYYALIGLFSFSMLGLVISHHLLSLFVCWELVGLSSYLLIGYWREQPVAVSAAFKAFMINRAGDIGLLIGLLLLWVYAGTLDILDIKEHLSSVPMPTATLIGCCIFLGVMTKSAQVPFFSWLPDAMKGPTPVSALIHAATMVAAGVFLVGRIYFVFTADVRLLMAVIGSITACYGALAACVQFDIKRILAYSTISQLGWMVMAMGVSHPASANLHLITHAFFKAGLFLAAGAVLFSLQRASIQKGLSEDTQDIRNLGALQDKLPLTFAIFVVFAGSLAGLPLSSGFLSKESILTGIQSPVFLVIGWLITSLTAIYAFRMIWYVFLAPSRSAIPWTKSDISVVPRVMQIPMIVLAVASSWIIVSANPIDFAGWMYNGLSPGSGRHSVYIGLISSLLVIAAISISYWYYRSQTHHEEPALHRWLRNDFGIDRFYTIFFLEPSLRLSSLVSRIDGKLIDGLLHFAGYTHVTLAYIAGWLDRAIIDGLANGSGKASLTIGLFARSFVNGKIQSYILWAMIALVVITAWILLN